MTRALLARWVRGLPLLGPLVRRIRSNGQPPVPFLDSADYWERRYAAGGDSGAGSYGKFAEFKARVLNNLFQELELESVIEFGCGDGNQLALLQVPDYLGIDISAGAIARCRGRFSGQAGRRFLVADDYQGEVADCSLSLDVIYHLVEDEVFDAYMRRLFGAARKCVVIYSSNRPNEDAPSGDHVRHRVFADWIATSEPGWALWRHVPNEHPFQGDWRSGSLADFYVYRPVGNAL